MLRVLLVAAFRSTHPKGASQIVCCLSARAIRVCQFHQSCPLYKKRKKLDTNFIASIMSADPPQATLSDLSKAKKDVEVITLDDDSSDEVQEIPKSSLPESQMDNLLRGTAIYHPDCPLAKRHLDFTRTGKDVSKHGLKKGEVQFSVMSYNVLAQELLETHPHLYQYHNPNCLAWPMRFSKIIEEINFLKPDILCLQEVQATHLDSYFNAALKNLGYTGVFKQRTGKKCDGCAIYWKRSKINMIEQTSVEFFQPGVPLLDRDNIGLILRLSIEGQQVVVATTHLLYNPRRNDIRLAQVQLILAELDRLSHCKVGSKDKHSPIILTGDFNLNPFTSVYTLLSSGQLKYDSLTHPRLLARNGRSSPPVGRTLVPFFLGITDCCRHSSIMLERSENGDRIERCKETVRRELDLLCIHHSEREPKQSRRKSEPSESSDHKFGTGTLTHNLHLTSAYLHRRHGRPEATTHQDEWDTVDYIFFSKMPPEQRMKKLNLLSTWTLPTVDDCHILGPIPNLDAPSDHLPIMAVFLLS